MLTIDSNRLADTPFPHLVQPQIFEPSFYDELKRSYPAFAEAKDWRRMSRDLIAGDEQFADIVSQEPWKQLFDYVRSTAFLDEMIGLFTGCEALGKLSVSASHLVMTSHEEPRQWLRDHNVPEAIKAFDGNRHELFARMDFGRGDEGYYRPPHLDWRHRLCSMLIYFDDPSETDMEGGEFVINGKANDGAWLDHDVIAPMNNLAIIKLDSNESFHSVNKITKINGHRKTVFVTISSRGQIW